MVKTINRMISINRMQTLGIACGLALVLSSSVRGVDFVADVLPILDNRCFQCHGPEKQKGELRLDSREMAFIGGDSGDPAIVPGDSRASMAIDLIEFNEMPPKGDPVTASELDVLKKWIDSGAEWPDEANVVVVEEDKDRELVVTDSDREHWAFRPLARVDFKGREQNLIDSYFGDRVQEEEASKRVLVRRLYFDLIGLPPTPSQVDAFLNDESPDAYESLVDSLLANRHFGERWARHWLDVARYADSNGYEGDADRDDAWPYRDWVIRAMNDDLPFDTFTQWQLAGDEYEPENPDAVVATGFLAAGTQRIPVPSDTKKAKLKIRYDELDDIVGTTGSAMLGLTLACARCHDHKFDAIPARDYYRMVAAFSVTERGVYSLSKPRREFERWKDNQRVAWREFKMESLELSEAEKYLLRQPLNKSVTSQRALYEEYGDKLEIEDTELRAWLPDDERAHWDALEKAADEMVLDPLAPQQAFSVVDRQPEPIIDYLLDRGSVESRNEEVTFGFLQVMTRGKSPEDYWSEVAPEATRGDLFDESGFAHPRSTFQRKALAEWIGDVEHGAGPLVARVVVNRLWHHHFGEGFVPTPNDVGVQSEDPIHIDLLDTLSGALVSNDWRLKAIHKEIVMSAFYRMPSSGVAREGVPARRPIRLEVEALRDSILAVSGRLNRKMFGPPFRPIIPVEAISSRTTDAYPTDIQDGPELWRRSIYAFTKRSVPNPMMEVFDSPEPDISCGRRNTTTVPTQALTLMNNPFVRDSAVQFAQRVITEVGLDPVSQVDRAYNLALARPPSSDERARALEFLGAASDARGDRIPVEGLTNLCHLLFMLNEFIYVE